MKIITILGARPQFIKAGTVSRGFNKFSEIEEIIVHTGQHYDVNMSDVFFEQMKIPKPDYFLGIKGKSHASMTGQMMEKIEEVVIKENPDWVLVYGDTNSTLAGAIVASKLQVKLAHVEAGLRSYNMKMPEEINRIITDRLSNLLFSPTSKALENLDLEGYSTMPCTVINSGDVMKDGAEFYSSFARKPKLNIKGDYILCTIHRAENTDNKDNLLSIFKALEQISNKVQIVLPIHPRTLKKCCEYNIDMSKLIVIDPVGYFEMIWLIENSNLIITDSGGLQKESYFFSKSCIVLREETEWVELIENNFNVLVGANTKNIIEKVKTYKFNKKFSSNLYGTGDATNIIIESLLNYNQL
mgnify:CR=1 FL=1|tara:strand:- start:1170 stop:2237 length:1068 start_codon:yes stop_codon:yes gene_type:complete